MINSILRYGLIFILLIMAQVLVFNNIQFSGYVNPYVYIMFILLLPVDIPAWLLLLLSFATGLIIDFFSGTPGMHTSATLTAGFVRPYVLLIHQCLLMDSNGFFHIHFLLLQFTIQLSFLLRSSGLQSSSVLSGE